MSARHNWITISNPASLGLVHGETCLPPVLRAAHGYSIVRFPILPPGARRVSRSDERGDAISLRQATMEEAGLTMDYNGSQLSEIKVQSDPADVMNSCFCRRLCDVWRFNYLLRNDLLMGLLTLLSLSLSRVIISP